MAAESPSRDAAGLRSSVADGGIVGNAACVPWKTTADCGNASAHPWLRNEMTRLTTNNLIDKKNEFPPALRSLQLRSTCTQTGVVLIFDEDYTKGGFPSVGYLGASYNAYPGDPQTYGVTLRIRG